MCIVHTCTYIDIHTYLFNNYLGDSTCGQRALYQMGLTGIPIFNVNNNCATGSSALHWQIKWYPEVFQIVYWQWDLKKCKEDP